MTVIYAKSHVLNLAKRASSTAHPKHLQPANHTPDAARPPPRHSVVKVGHHRRVLPVVPRAVAVLLLVPRAAGAGLRGRQRAARVVVQAELAPAGADLRGGGGLQGGVLGATMGEGAVRSGVVA